MPRVVPVHIVAALCVLLLSLPSWAQQPIGHFTPGHPLRAATPSGSFSDGGGAAGSPKFGEGYLTELGITNTGLPFCINDALTSVPFHRFCFGHDASGNALIDIGHFNGASVAGVRCVINGAVVPCFGGTVQGNDATVPNNATLQTTIGAVGTRVLRLGYATPGDGGIASYNWSDSDCTAPDNGAQTQPVVTTGCWIADLGSQADLRVWTGAPAGADLTARVQAALDAECGHGPLWVPQVVSPFFVTTVRPKSNCVATGAGWNSWIKQLDGFNGPIFDIGGLSNVTISNLELDGNKANNTGPNTYCIATLGSGATNVVIENNKIHDCGNDGVSYAGSNIKINNNFFNSIGAPANGNASATENALGLTASNVTQFGNYVDGTNGPGLACGFDGCHAITFESNIIRNVGQGSEPADGITAYHFQNTDLSVLNNDIDGSGNNCIHVGGNRARVIGNGCRNITNRGIVLVGTIPWNAGTVQMTTGSKEIIGTSTNWLSTGFDLDGFAANIFLNGIGYIGNIAKIVDDTHIQMQTPYAGSSAIGLSYSLKYTSPQRGAIVANNSVTNNGGGSVLEAIWVQRYAGATVTGNTIDTTGLGMTLANVSGGTVSANSVNNSLNSCFYMTGLAQQAVGTIAVTNGSTGVTGSGTNWTETLPLSSSGVIMRIAGDGKNYTGTITGDGSLVLDLPYSGTTNPASDYYLVAAPSTGLTITGNSGNSCASDAYSLNSIMDSQITGNVALGSTGYPIAEIGASLGNTIGPNTFRGNTLNRIRSLIDSLPIPSVSCAGADATVQGSNYTGVISVGAGVSTSCTVTFSNRSDADPAFFDPPNCIAQVRNIGGSSAFITANLDTWDTLGVTFAFNADVHGRDIMYICRVTGSYLQ